MSVAFSGQMFFIYAEAYLDAAKRLAQVETREYREGDWNTFAMPLLFLFRHYLELGLKACICMKKEIEILRVASEPETSREKASKALKTMDEKLKCTHDLSKLVAELKNQFPHGEGFFSKSVQDYLSYLSDYDRKSDVFRYPLDSKGDWLRPDHPIMRIDEIKKMIKETSRELN